MRHEKLIAQAVASSSETAAVAGYMHAIHADIRGGNVDWLTINKTICGQWGKAGLTAIKLRAWNQYDRLRGASEI